MRGDSYLGEDEHAMVVTVKFPQHGRQEIQLATRLDQRTSLKHAVRQPRRLLAIKVTVPVTPKNSQHSH